MFRETNSKYSTVVYASLYVHIVLVGYRKEVICRSKLDNGYVRRCGCD